MAGTIPGEPARGPAAGRDGSSAVSPATSLAGRVLVLALLLAPVPRPVRQRWRLRAPAEAAAADRLADRAWVVVAALAAAWLAAAALPRLPDPLPRAYCAAVGVGLLTGVPYLLDRRALRARLAGAPTPPPPLPEEGTTRGEAETLHRAALAAATAGDARRARACALRAVQLDPARWPVLSDAGLVLCRRGRFGAGAWLCERGLERSAGDPHGRLAMVEALRLAGRLRDAVATLDDRGRVGLAGAAATPAEHERHG